MYTVMRCDRVGIRGGGVCLFVKRHFHVLRNDLTPTPAGVELLCFDLLGFDATYRFFIVYRPPASHSINKNGVKSLDTMSLLVNCLESNLN